MSIKSTGRPYSYVSPKRWVAALGVCALLLAACGGDADSDAETTEPEGTEEAEETTEPEGTEEAADTDTPDPEDDPFSITLGLSPFQDTLLPIIGTEFGWFEEVGLDIELVTLEWGSIVPAVASGQVDIAVNNTTGVVSAAHRQPELIYWYGWNPFTEGAALMGDPDSGLQSVDDFIADGMDEEEARDAAILQLEGREIVTTMGTDMGKNVLAALDSVGLGAEDVEIRDLDPDSGLAAFLSGTGDAYLGGIPQRTRATADGYTVIASGPQLSAPPINGIVTTSSYAEEHEGELLAFLDVIFRIVDHCNANTAECGDIITTELNSQTGADMSVEDFEQFWQGWENFAANPEEVEEWILDEDGFAYWRATWDTDNEFLFEETGDIPSPADPDEHFWGERVHERYLEVYGR